MDEQFNIEFIEYELAYYNDSIISEEMSLIIKSI